MEGAKENFYNAPKTPKLIYTAILWDRFVVRPPPPAPEGGAARQKGGGFKVPGLVRFAGKIEVEEEFSSKGGGGAMTSQTFLAALLPKTSFSCGLFSWSTSRPTRPGGGLEMA